MQFLREGTTRANQLSPGIESPSTSNAEIVTQCLHSVPHNSAHFHPSPSPWGAGRKHVRCLSICATTPAQNLQRQHLDLVGASRVSDTPPPTPSQVALQTARVQKRLSTKAYSAYSQ
ncbi:unnamed protein product [Ectocarpus sp. 8 AP-2014]